MGKPMALVISTVCVRLDPCSGRSDAMMNCGEPLPPYWSGWHEDEGRACARLTFPVATPAMTSATPTTATSGTPYRIRFFTLPPWLIYEMRWQVSAHCLYQDSASEPMTP